MNIHIGANFGFQRLWSQSADEQTVSLRLLFLINCSLYLFFFFCLTSVSSFLLNSTLNLFMVCQCKIKISEIFPVDLRLHLTEYTTLSSSFYYQSHLIMCSIS